MQPIHERLEALKKVSENLFDIEYMNVNFSGSSVTIFMPDNQVDGFKHLLREYKMGDIFLAYGLNIRVRRFGEQEHFERPIMERKEVVKPLPVRYFFTSYNGINPQDGKTVIGHLAFTSQGYPSMLFITEQLIPKQSKVKITDVVITMLNELKSEDDFNKFITGWDMNSQLGDIIGLN